MLLTYTSIVLLALVNADDESNMKVHDVIIQVAVANIPKCKQEDVLGNDDQCDLKFVIHDDHKFIPRSSYRLQHNIKHLKNHSTEANIIYQEKVKVEGEATSNLLIELWDYDQNGRKKDIKLGTFEAKTVYGSRKADAFQCPSQSCRLQEKEPAGVKNLTIDVAITGAALIRLPIENTTLTRYAGTIKLNLIKTTETIMNNESVYEFTITDMKDILPKRTFRMFNPHGATSEAMYAEKVSTSIPDIDVILEVKQNNGTIQSSKSNFNIQFNDIYHTHIIDTSMLKFNVEVRGLVFNVSGECPTNNMHMTLTNFTLSNNDQFKPWIRATVTTQEGMKLMFLEEPVPPSIINGPKLRYPQVATLRDLGSVNQVLNIIIAHDNHSGSGYSHFYSEATHTLTEFNISFLGGDRTCLGENVSAAGGLASSLWICFELNYTKNPCPTNAPSLPQHQPDSSSSKSRIGSIAALIILIIILIILIVFGIVIGIFIWYAVVDSKHQQRSSATVSKAVTSTFPNVVKSQQERISTTEVEIENDKSKPISEKSKPASAAEELKFPSEITKVPSDME